MSWITRVGNIVTIYHRRRDLHPHKSATEIPTRTAFILLGRREPELSINYHDPVGNKKQDNTQLTLKAGLASFIIRLVTL